MPPTTKSPSLEDRFALASEAAPARTIWLASGEAGTGKTSLALSLGGPTLIQSLDKGTEGLASIREARNRGTKIYVKEYDWTPEGSGSAAGADDFNQDYARKVRDEIIADYRYAMKAGVRVIIWDKETDIWEVFRYAEFGKPSASAKDYAKLNQRYMALINESKATTISFCLIQGMKAEWGKSADGKPTPTGQRIRSGFDRLDEIAFLDMLHTRQDGKFAIHIGKCRQATHLQDQPFTWTPLGSPDDSVDFSEGFASLGPQLVDGSTAEDWTA